MLRRVLWGAALLVAVAAGVRAESLLDYKNAGAEKTISESVADISGDDAESRRVASERLIELVKTEAAALGSDPKAEGTFKLFAEGMVQLVDAGKATSRVRAERIMDEALSALDEALKSSDKARADAAARSLAAMAEVVSKNPDNASAEKFAASIKELFERAAIDPATIPPAPKEEVAATEAPKAEAPQPAPETVPPAAAPTPAPETVPVAAAPVPVPLPIAAASPAPVQSVPVAPAPAPAPTPAVAEQKAAKPEVAVVAPPAPVKAKTEEIRTIAVTVAPPPPPKPRTAEFPLTQVKANSSALYAENPAYKVITVVAPPRSRPGYREEQARAAEIVRKKLSSTEGDSPNDSLMNIILDQLRSGDAGRIDSGLKLTSRVSEVILAARSKNPDSSATLVQSKARDMLRHPEGRVKRSAALAATALKDKLAVRPLIDLLVSDEETTVSTARAALYSIVGVDLGTAQRPWLDWAAANQPR